MCGIFAFVSKRDRGPDPRILDAIALSSQQRGRHAFGFAWVDSRDRLRMFKQPGAIGDHLGLLGMAADARMLIGHCRYATAGNPRNNLNNHPHPVDGGWFVHNGVVRHAEDLIESRKLHPVTRCDSEVLGLLTEAADGELQDRFFEAAGDCKSGPLAMMGLWHNPARMICLRSDQPLYFAETAHGYYLASLSAGLPAGNYLIRNHTGVWFARSPAETELLVYDLSAEMSLSH